MAKMRLYRIAMPIPRFLLQRCLLTLRPLPRMAYRRTTRALKASKRTSSFVRQQHICRCPSSQNSPTLPNTDPNFALSFDSQIANPSPKRLCAFPSTLNSTSTCQFNTLNGMRDQSHPFCDGLSWVRRTCLLVFCSFSHYVGVQAPSSHGIGP